MMMLAKGIFTEDLGGQEASLPLCKVKPHNNTKTGSRLTDIGGN